LEEAEVLVSIIDHKIDVRSVRAYVDSSGFGAILVFEGVARDNFQGKAVGKLEYEAYAPMAEAVMKKIGDECLQKWPNIGIAIVHRTGTVQIGEPSLVIAVGSPHRPECYEANRYILEEIKVRLPVWKKEVYDDGSEWKANN
jgi:molybdopterin synthase catalytic subunit